MRHEMSRELTPKQRRAVQALSEHGSMTEAAQAAGVARQSLYRWVQEPEFAHALSQATSQQLEQASRELTSLTGEAVAVLRELLKSKSEHIRRLSAVSIIEHSLRLRELVELEHRVKQLEERKHEN